MNVEIGTEAAQFPEKEYINGNIRSIEYSSWLIDWPLSGRLLIKSNTVKERTVLGLVCLWSSYAL